MSIQSSTIAASLLCAAAGLAQAAIVPFHAAVEGNSQIVEFLDPVGPVVRVQTQATGSSSLGALSYLSGDILNLATGQGTGTNRFITDDGDELFGSFTVQLVPGANASLFDLIGQMAFTGGTGEFLGASGIGSFLGHGQFTSQTFALTRFAFDGRLSTVPEPASALLAALGLGLCAVSRRARSSE